MRIFARGHEGTWSEAKPSDVELPICRRKAEETTPSPGGQLQKCHSGQGAREHIRAVCGARQ